MKVGDLVMLSSYGLNMAPMWNWRREAAKGKCPVGIVVKVRDNPRIYEWTSENDKTFFMFIGAVKVQLAAITAQARKHQA